MTGILGQFLALALLALTFEPRAAKAQTPQTSHILVAYTPTSSNVHNVLRNLLMERRVLEYMQQVLSPLRLPKPLLFRPADCDGEINAGLGQRARCLCRAAGRCAAA
jgi:hypothetical protein